MVLALAHARGAEVAKVPVPSSPYLPVVYRFADTMIERGRDVYGPEKTGLFLSALDRTAVAPLTNRPPAPRGVREADRVGSKDGPLVGSNPQHDQNLLRLLYTLSELSTKPKYRDAANAELKWLISRPAPEAVNIFISGRPWLLWEQCFSAERAGSERFAKRLYEMIITGSPRASSRQPGSIVRACAVAYRNTTNEQYLRALSLLENDKRAADFKALSSLSFAIDCDGAARYVPQSQAAGLRDMSTFVDKLFTSLAHPLKEKGGFFVTADLATSKWNAETASRTTAQVAMMCVSRYENTGNVAYRDLVHAAADVYLDSEPTEADDVWPMTVGHVISLEVAAWRSTAQQRYLDRARYFGDWALKTFFDAPLPRASTKSNHYESITGADTLALALVELHLHILGITAVRCPANTIDR